MSHSVLVVDDDADVRTSIRKILETYTFVVVEARSSVEALQAIRQAIPDVIITDIYMPGGDGYELMNSLRERPVRIPLSAMSGDRPLSGIDQLALAEKPGSTAILDKPFRPSNLVEMVDRVIAGRGAPARS